MPPSSLTAGPRSRRPALAQTVRALQFPPYILRQPLYDPFARPVVVPLDPFRPTRELHTRFERVECQAALVDGAGAGDGEEGSGEDAGGGLLGIRYC